MKKCVSMILIAGLLFSLVAESATVSSFTGFAGPTDVAIDSQDTMYVVEFSNNQISKVLPDGSTSILVRSSLLNSPAGITLDANGDLYVSSFGGGTIFKLEKDGSFSTFASVPGQTTHITSANGKLYVTSWDRHAIYEIPIEGDTHRATLLAGIPLVRGGADGSAFEATFNGPNGIAVNRDGTILYVSDEIGLRQINLDATQADPITLNAGFNDAWFNPDTNGQGFFITVFPELGFVSLAWFTYDTELPATDASANLGDAGHRWLTALGEIDGNKSVMGISIATGGLFDTPTEITNFDDGSITLSFENCNSGTIEYDIPSINRQGTASKSSMS